MTDPELQRMAQESLNNAIRHAEAEAVDIDLSGDPDGVTLRVTDDGRGFNTETIPEGQLGIGIMRERAQEIGAVLEIHSEIGKGTEVSVSWS